MRIKAGRPPTQVRREQYPQIGDQLGAIHKGFKALLEQGFTLPAETIDWIAAVDRVKETNPTTPSVMEERNHP